MQWQLCWSSDKKYEQECIPVGCALSAALAVSEGVFDLAGVGGLSAPGGGRGMSILGGWVFLGGVCQPPVDRVTDACENSTLPQLCCRR